MKWMRCGGILLLLVMAGCSLEPASASRQRKSAAEAGRRYQRDFSQRQIPDLPDQPTWQDVLQRAFLANGELEAAYFDWKAAVDVIRGMGEWPNTLTGLNYSYFWSQGSIKGWNRTNLSLQSDPSMTVAFPAKTAQAAKIAYDDAQTKSRRFAEAKFALQQKVLTTYYDYALTLEKFRLQQESVGLLKVIADSAAQRVQAGGAQEDLLRSQTEYELGNNDLENLKVDVIVQRANLNAMLARAPDAELEIPRLPSPRSWKGQEDAMILQAIEGNPELASLAAELTSRNDAIRMAELAWIPDFNIGFAWQGEIQKTFNYMAMLPTTVLRISGQVEAARANVRQAQATTRQARSDKAAEFVSAFCAFHNAQRQVELFRQRIHPRAQQSWENSTRLYSSGQSGVVDFIQSQRTLLQVRQSEAEAAMSREKKLVEMEALAGVDLEALAVAATQPAPASQPAAP